MHETPIVVPRVLGKVKRPFKGAGGGSGTFLGLFFVLKYVIVLSETISTLFTEFKKLVEVSSSVRWRFPKYRGFHTFREL